jgi:pimeloyl-[acyl-carrier protein] methyl ester esterase
MRPFVLVGGWGFRGSVWDATAGYLAGLGPVTALGAGDLFRAGDPVRALAEAIRACPAPPRLVGWSLGGTLAAEAVASGETVEGLALIAATPRFVAAGDDLPGSEAAALRAMRAGCRRDPGPVLSAFFQEAATRPEDAALAAAHADAEPGPLLAGLEHLATRDLRGWTLPPVPALIVHGKGDRIVPLNACRAWKPLLPAAELIRLERVGHDLPLSIPRLLAGLLRGWVLGPGGKVG